MHSALNHVTKGLQKLRMIEELLIPALKKASLDYEEKIWGGERDDEEEELTETCFFVGQLCDGRFNTIAWGVMFGQNDAEDDNTEIFVTLSDPMGDLAVELTYQPKFDRWQFDYDDRWEEFVDNMQNNDDLLPELNPIPEELALTIVPLIVQLFYQLEHRYDRAPATAKLLS